MRGMVYSMERLFKGGGGGGDSEGGFLRNSHCCRLGKMDGGFLDLCMVVGWMGVVANVLA